MLNKLKIFLYYWLPVFIYCLLIYSQSSDSFPDAIPDFFLMDKILHFSAYAVLAILVSRAFAILCFKNRLNLQIILSIAASTLYGVSDEIHQHFNPFRHADIMDVLADMAGSIFGVYIYNKFLVKLPLLIKLPGSKKVNIEDGVPPGVLPEKRENSVPEK